MTEPNLPLKGLLVVAMDQAVAAPYCASRLADAGARTAGFAIAAVIARPVGGWLSDRIGPATVLSISLAGAAVDSVQLSESARVAFIGRCSFHVLFPSLR